MVASRPGMNQGQSGGGQMTIEQAKNYVRINGSDDITNRSDPKMQMAIKMVTQAAQGGDVEARQILGTPENAGPTGSSSRTASVPGTGLPASGLGSAGAPDQRPLSHLSGRKPNPSTLGAVERASGNLSASGSVGGSPDFIPTGEQGNRPDSSAATPRSASTPLAGADLTGAAADLAAKADVARNGAQGRGVNQRYENLGGNLNGMNSAYLQGVDPGDPAFMNSLLMAQGYDSGSYMSQLLGPVAKGWTGMNALANPGLATSQASQLQNSDTMYSNLAGGKGGVGMIDAQALYDNLFTDDGMGVNGYLNHNADPKAQFTAVSQLLDSLSGVMPPESLNMLMGNVQNYYLEYSNMVNTSGPNQMSFIDYLKSMGAADWF